MARRNDLLVLAATAILFASPFGARADNLPQASLEVSRPRCEYLENPLGIDVGKPRLSWIVKPSDVGRRGLKQTAYRILVASTTQRLARNEGDLWDSGRVESERTLHVSYDGKSLDSRMQCHWKVRAWDNEGQPSPWSGPAMWTMGLLQASDWRAKWITHHDPSLPPPIAPRHGYQTWLGKSADEAQWVAVDLGEVHQIDCVRLYPTYPDGGPPDALGFRPYGFQPGSPGVLVSRSLSHRCGRKGRLLRRENGG